MNFALFFPNYGDHHFYKDPGQIPLRLKNRGVDSKIVCFNRNQDCSITEEHITVQRIKLKILGFSNLSILHYMLFNAKRIDCLCVYHICFSSLFTGYVYKRLNKKGFVYLKMDNNSYTGPYAWEKAWEHRNQFPKWKNFLMKSLFVQSVNLFSIEDYLSYDYFRKKYSFMKDKLLVSFNGHTGDLFHEIKIGKEFKQNIVLTAGRLGTYQKATENLLQAISILQNTKDWRFVFAGDTTPDFESYKRKFLAKNPHLSNCIIFTGQLSKKDLFMLLTKAKIFCLPSRYEAFANVIGESFFYQNAMVATDKISCFEMIDKSMGLIVPPDDIDKLAESIQELITNQNLLLSYSERAKRFASRYLSWDEITLQLLQEIQYRRSTNDPS